MKKLVKSDVVPWTIWDVLVIIVFSFFCNVTLGFLAAVLGFSITDIGFMAFAQVVLSLIPVITIVLLIKYLYKSSPISLLGLSVSHKTWKTYLFAGLVISIIIIVSNFIFAEVYFFIAHKHMPDPYSGYSLEKLKMMAILAVFVAPVIEEVIFRGFIQPSVCMSFGSLPGIILTSVLFAFMHSQYLSYPEAMVVIINLSLLLGFSRQVYNSTIPAIVGHLLNNVYAAIGVFLIGKF